jgi:hypothetical protein
MEKANGLIGWSVIGLTIAVMAWFAGRVLGYQGIPWLIVVAIAIPTLPIGFFLQRKRSNRFWWLAAAAAPLFACAVFYLIAVWLVSNSRM